MKPPSNEDARDMVRNKLIGLGELSMRKSYFPELKSRIEELEKFRAIIEQARDVLFVIEADTGAFVDVNKAAIRKTGYEREKLFTLTVMDILPDKNCALLDLLRGGKNIADNDEVNDYFQTEIIAADGNRIPVEMTVREHREADHNYLVIVARDITKRLKAERELCRTRNYLGNVIDSLQSILVGVDSDIRVILWNDYAQKETGIASSQAEGRLIGELLPELKPFEDLISRTVRENYNGEKEIFEQERNGERAVFELMVYPFAGEEGVGAVIRIDDITARTHMEEVMIQTEKMMTVGGLAAGMAHEINNPLSGILQSSQNILRRLSVELPANHNLAIECGTNINSIFKYCSKRGILEKISSIRHMGNRAAKIVSNMLQFSRGSTEVKREDNIKTIVEDAVEISFSDYNLQKKYGLKTLEIVKKFDSDLPSVVCNSSEIEQVVINLISNSAQAMSVGYTGDRPRICISLTAQENGIRLEIADNGPGMNEDVRKKAIEPFFTTKEVGEGTGLGLFVSYFIITQKCGGSFIINSIPGHGTRIEITIPAA